MLNIRFNYILLFLNIGIRDKGLFICKILLFTSFNYLIYSAVAIYSQKINKKRVKSYLFSISFETSLIILNGNNLSISETKSPGAIIPGLY